MVWINVPYTVSSLGEEAKYKSHIKVVDAGHD